MISNPASCCFKYRSRRTDQWHCNSRTASGNGPWLCCAVVGGDGGCRLLSGCTTLLASGCALSPNMPRMLRHHHHGGSCREIVPENPVLAHTFILILRVKAQSNLEYLLADDLSSNGDLESGEFQTIASNETL
jgi:hypothetical protein